MCVAIKLLSQPEKSLRVTFIIIMAEPTITMIQIRSKSESGSGGSAHLGSHHSGGRGKPISVSSKPARTTKGVAGQPGVLHKETLSRKTKKQTKKQIRIPVKCANLQLQKLSVSWGRVDHSQWLSTIAEQSVGPRGPGLAPLQCLPRVVSDFVASFHPNPLGSGTVCFCFLNILKGLGDAANKTC